MAPNLPRYSPDLTLTPAQHHVLALLAEGQTISKAAAEAGVHRNTVRNWRRTVPAFAREMEFAVREQAFAWHQQAVELAPRATEVLHDLLHNAHTPAAVRLRAALAILKMAAQPQTQSTRKFNFAALEIEQQHELLLAKRADRKMHTLCTTKTKKMHNRAQRRFQAISDLPGARLINRREARDHRKTVAIPLYLASSADRPPSNRNANPLSTISHLDQKAA